MFRGTLWGSLLSIGLFCDQNCTAVYKKHTVHIYDNNNNLLLSGHRSKESHNLWMIDLEHEVKHVNHQIAAIQGGITNIEQRIQWFHRTYGSPVPSTFIQALHHGWIKPHGFSIKTVERYQHILHSTQSAEGHLDQTRKNAQSTTKVKERRIRHGEESIQPTHVWTQLVERNHMDATGRFPVVSVDGKQYIMIFYSEHGNYIKVFAIANRTKACIVAVYEEALRFFKLKV